MYRLYTDSFYKGILYVHKVKLFLILDLKELVEGAIFVYQ